MLQHPTSCKANLSQRFTMQGNNTHVESTQRCSGCGNEKPTTAFNRDRTTKTGRKYKCRECSRAMRKRRAQEYAKVEHPDDATKRCPQCQVEKPPRRHKDKKRWRIRYLFEGEWHEARQGYASEGSARDAIRTFQQKKHRLYPKGWRGPTVRIDAVDGLMIKNNLTGETVTLNVC